MSRKRRSSPRSDPPPASPATERSTWLVLIALGIGVRLLLSAVALGTNDAPAFWGFGYNVLHTGLLQSYRSIAELNHPPIPILWSAAATWIATALGGELRLFGFIFRLPVIAADAVAVGLLYRIWRSRGDGSRRWAVAAMYAWALAPILVSGYHTNTDTVYAMLSLLSVYLLEDRRRPGFAGVALAAAINIKLIPVLLVPPLLLSIRDRKEAVRFVAGLACGVLPFVPLLIGIGPEFVRNVLAYSPKPDRWGLLLPLLWSRQPPLDPSLDAWVISYKVWGRYLIVALVVGWTIWAGWRARCSRYELAAVTYAIFLVFTSGFGAQYTAVIAPMLIAVRPLTGLAYSTLSGLAILVLYGLTWDGDYPVGSMILVYLPAPAAVLGAAAWVMLVAYIVLAVRNTASRQVRLVA